MISQLLQNKRDPSQLALFSFPFLLHLQDLGEQTVPLKVSLEDRVVPVCGGLILEGEECLEGEGPGRRGAELTQKEKGTRQ